MDWDPSINYRWEYGMGPCCESVAYSLPEEEVIVFIGLIEVCRCNPLHGTMIVPLHCCLAATTIISSPWGYSTSITSRTDASLTSRKPGTKANAIEFDNIPLACQRNMQLDHPFMHPKHREKAH